jgi:hypothetical protein
MNTKLLSLQAVCLVFLASSAFAADTAPKPDTSGKLLFDARYRLESVDDDAFTKNAFADTLRLRIGYQSGVYNGFSGVVALEGTTYLFSDDFNSTANGNTQYPVIADPNSYELDLAYLSYAPNENGKFNLGRQRIIIDNQRFFGNVGWRQNEQTFDGIDLNYKFGKNFTLRYDYINRVQRVFGAENSNKDLYRWDLNLNLFHADYTIGPGKLTGYVYLNENETLPLTSHKNFGARYVFNKTASNGVGWLGTAEYAKQDSYADGASSIDADYLLLEGGVVYKGNTFKAGYEQLGGNGQYGFQTPYATLHAFNGWADRFLTTPKNGLQDSYLSWNRKFGKFGATVVWHDFNSDYGSMDYGTEWDASLSWAFAKKWTALAKLADYNADQYLVDTTKLWLSVEYIY